MKKLVFFAMLLSALSFGALAANGNLSSQDKMWLKAAHQVNLEEMQSGALAHQMGGSSKVRNIGETLESDHRNFDAKLVPVAQQLGVALPNEPTAKDQAEIKKLQGESGSAFDTAYVRGEIKGHEQAIAKTRQEIADGSSMQVKQLAQECLPVLQKHLKMVRDANMMHGG